jgi:hypothetical protein
MNVPEFVTSLYPVALAGANIGVGVGLYETGTLFFALILWLSGALVVAGLASSVWLSLSQLGEDSA